MRATASISVGTVDAPGGPAWGGLRRQYGLRRLYQTTPQEDGGIVLRLSDREAELPAREHDLYRRLADWMTSARSEEELRQELGLDDARLGRLVEALRRAGLLYRRQELPASVTGEQLHERFSRLLKSWLDEAFSHPFWERMMSGAGSQRLFVGWLIELYHYTRNANRHMPLSCAYAAEKKVKALRARHYAEEWNHYHYFMKALKALGYTEAQISRSVPLPMTLALSNFMRQAAREDVLAYSICSAVLEGTTTDRGTYNPYYARCAELYGVPQEAIRPIYQHLDLDVQYQHSDLFLDILRNVQELPAERAGRVLDYGHQLAEHIWLWTDSIQKYYDGETNPVPRRPFDPRID